jgi:SAM-dependent methyltransferase
MSSASEPQQNWYEYPHLYDLAFGWDPGTEVGFVEAAFDRYARRPIRRIFEPFVGPGRIAIALAARGYQVAGLDLEPAAIAFARKRADERGVSVDWAVGDLAAWSADRTFDAVVTLIDSFRYLLTADAAESAIRSFANATGPGGVLIIGIDVGAKPPELTDEEQWTMERDGTVVETTVFDLRKSGQAPGTSLVRSVLRVTERDGAEYNLTSEAAMRLYTLDSFLELVTGRGEFETVGVFDRHYDLDRPADRGREFGDVVAVFRRTDDPR